MIAVGLGLLGLALVSAAVPESAADDGSLPIAIGGLVLSLAGFVSLLGALARWSRRARPAAVARPQPGRLTQRSGPRSFPGPV